MEDKQDEQQATQMIEGKDAYTCQRTAAIQNQNSDRGHDQKDTLQKSIHHEGIQNDHQINIQDQFQNIHHEEDLNNDEAEEVELPGSNQQINMFKYNSTQDQRFTLPPITTKSRARDTNELMVSKFFEQAKIYEEVDSQFYQSVTKEEGKKLSGNQEDLQSQFMNHPTNQMNNYQNPSNMKKPLLEDTSLSAKNTEKIMSFSPENMMTQTNFPPVSNFENKGSKQNIENDQKQQLKNERLKIIPI